MPSFFILFSPLFSPLSLSPLTHSLSIYLTLFPSISPPPCLSLYPSHHLSLSDSFPLSLSLYLYLSLSGTLPLTLSFFSLSIRSFGPSEGTKSRNAHRLLWQDRPALGFYWRNFLEVRKKESDREKLLLDRGKKI